MNEVWSSCRDFTKLMRSDIFPKIADRLGLRCYSRDYYTLDGIFYAETDTNHFPSGTTYAKFISVALEHENNPVGTAVEMNKLQLFNSPLKVLITYPSNDDHGKELLDSYTEIVTEADAFDDIATLRRQLVIFGFQGESPRWQGFAYVQRSFTGVE
ncbi:MAG: hypothetical protein HY235_29155 [Acidobacteria bacterium]|nr:hypothetical protein [Acidobacteriota bacterium]